MVVETSLGAALGVAAIPHAHVHGVDGGVDGRFASGKRMAGEQPPQSPDVDPPAAQRLVEAAPATAMRSLQAQMDRRRDRFRGEQSVGEFEEGISAAAEAVVE
jgi:hypothetical protein